jgi:hypothetical protein
MTFVTEVLLMKCETKSKKSIYLTLQKPLKSTRGIQAEFFFREYYVISFDFHVIHAKDDLIYFNTCVCYVFGMD